MNALYNNENAFENFSNLLNQFINDLGNTGTEITSENINIYYGHMSNEMKEEYGEILHPILTDRRSYIDSILDLKLKDLSFSYDKKGNWISYCYFGIQDTLKPIDEYINQIKESEQYKISTSECRCNNCMTYFKSDDELNDAEDDEGEFKACPECNTDAYLMDTEHLKS